MDPGTAPHGTGRRLSVFISDVMLSPGAKLDRRMIYLAGWPRRYWRQDTGVCIMTPNRHLRAPLRPTAGQRDAFVRSANGDDCDYHDCDCWQGEECRAGPHVGTENPI
jgi:hypothetical protein